MVIRHQVGSWLGQFKAQINVTISDMVGSRFVEFKGQLSVAVRNKVVFFI